MTTVSFSRKFDTGDKNDFELPNKKGDDTAVFWEYSKDEAKKDGDNFKVPKPDESGDFDVDLVKTAPGGKVK